MKEEIKNIKEDIKDIRDNHLRHMQVDIAKTKTNVAWVMRFFWIIATASIGGLIASVIALI